MVTFWAFLRFHLLLWGLCAAWRVLRWTVTAAVLVAAAPVTLVAAIALAGAWLRGWPPRPPALSPPTPAYPFRIQRVPLLGQISTAIMTGWRRRARWPVTLAE